MTRIKPKEQEAEKRIKNFSEVCEGYTEEEAVKEAERCLQCKNAPCIGGCTVGIDIPRFIKHIKDGDFGKAIGVIKESSNLPAVCGRVCPQETQCEAPCIRKKMDEAINIGKLERFAADQERRAEAKEVKECGKKVAIVGSGPAGLTCAYHLALNGVKVEMFESLHVAGGVLVYGIPEFRLPKKIVEKEIEFLKGLGVKIKTDYLVGQTKSVEELSKEYDSVFIGTGAGLPWFLGIEGEDLNNVYSANEFLVRVNLMKAFDEKHDTPILPAKHSVVIGGGNVAIDAARCARRLGSEVTIVYRRTEKEMPARIEEIEHAKEEGINIKILTNPKKILGEGKVEGMECEEMKLGEPDDSGRARPESTGKNFTLDCDQVIVAIGQGSNPLISDTTPSLEVNKWGNIIVDTKFKTSLNNVYAGGDIVSGAATVIEAMGEGKKAADAMIKQIVQS